MLEGNTGLCEDVSSDIAAAEKGELDSSIESVAE